MARSDIDMLAIEHVILDVNLPLREAIAHVEMLSKVRHISIECNLTTEANVLGDIHRLRQLFTLLLDNSVSYSYENQTVLVTTEVVQNTAKELQWGYLLLIKALAYLKKTCRIFLNVATVVQVLDNCALMAADWDYRLRMH